MVAPYSLLNILETYGIRADTPLVIACSGGPDSIGLMEYLLETHQSSSCIVAHFHHRIRGADADGDARYARAYAESHGCHYEEWSADVPALALALHQGIEETAREARYEWLETVRRSYSAPYILTAHHADDLVETMVFNIVRGSRLGGLTSLKACSGTILRPLLGVTKGEILDTLAERGIVARHDASNDDTAYLRNHIRHDILPEFVRINPSYPKAFFGLSQYASELLEYMDREVEKVVTIHNPMDAPLACSFSLDDFEGLRFFMQKECIRYLYEHIHGRTVGLSEGNIWELLDFILTARGGEKSLHELRLEKKERTLFVYAVWQKQ